MSTDRDTGATGGGQAPLPPPPAGPGHEPGPERVLRRSRDDQVVAGVAAGLGRYLGVDPVVVRIAFVVLALFGGSGIVAYLVGWLVIPEEPAGADASPGTRGASRSVGTSSVVLGVLLVAVGGILLLDQLVPGLRSLLGPMLLIALGLALIVRVRR